MLTDCHYEWWYSKSRARKDIVESLRCTPETNVTLYINSTGIKKKTGKNRIKKKKLGKSYRIITVSPSH